MAATTWRPPCWLPQWQSVFVFLAVLRDNLARSDLSKAQRVYAVTQRYSSEKDVPFHWDAPEVQSELGPKLAELGLAAPEVESLLQLGEAPEIVQRAVARGGLELESGVKIAKLETAAKKKVAEAVKKPVDTFCARRAKADLFQVPGTSCTDESPRRRGNGK